MRAYASSPTTCLIDKICVRILAKTGHLSTIYKQHAFPGAMLCEMACKCYVFGVVWHERSETKNQLLRTGRSIRHTRMRHGDKILMWPAMLPLVMVLTGTKCTTVK